MQSPQALAKRRVLLDDSWGFRVWQGEPNLMSAPHQHTDVEVNFVLSGFMRYFMAGRYFTVPSDQLVAFWAGVPHSLVAMAESTQCVWITVPVSWVLAWGLQAPFSSQLFEGALLSEASFEQASFDRALHLRWAEDFQSGADECMRIATLEIEARIRRLGLNAKASREIASPPTGSDPFQRICSYVMAHYTSDIAADDVAKAVGLHANYAMAVFKKNCGTSLGQYIARLRVWHAQRLLLTTDAKVLEVMFDSGFRSASRFYETFAKIAGHSPRDYRAFHRSIAGLPRE